MVSTIRRYPSAPPGPIGIGMGQNGTAVDCDSSDIVLQDVNFSGEFHRNSSSMFSIIINNNNYSSNNNNSSNNNSGRIHAQLPIPAIICTLDSNSTASRQLRPEQQQSPQQLLTLHSHPA
ncbi:hypothetical protein CF326_g8040 [Tilletia indica]|nr:hypothetical protein CF326_g8040 [Tilletia indica]